MKKCKKCGEVKKREFFSKDRIAKDGLKSGCKECEKKKTSEYRKTKEGVVTSLYGDQRNHSRMRNHKMPTYSKSELKDWLYSQKYFHELYNVWKNSGYKKEFKPSIDRLNDYKGYSFDNIRLTTWDKNNKKHYKDVKKGINNKASKCVIQLTLEGEPIKEWYSMHEAARNGFNRTAIRMCCIGKTSMHAGYKWKFKN